MGVKRAIEAASKALEQYSTSEGFLTKNVYTLGPLIHNPIVLKNLEQKGLKVLDSDNINSLEQGSVVIIRAHGTTPDVVKALENKQSQIIDCTCPKVHLSQKRARQSSQEGYSLIIAGDRNHGEVIGIEGYSLTDSVVIQTKEEAKLLDLGPKTVLIAQTTFSPTEFNQICEVLKEKAGSTKDLIIYNSICSATMERQTALDELKGKTDGIVVIGGKNSANTRRLYEKACLFCSKVVLIEDESEIPEDFYRLESVGITAGASTPDITIERVEQKLLRGF